MNETRRDLTTLPRSGPISVEPPAQAGSSFLRTVGIYKKWPDISDCCQAAAHAKKKKKSHAGVGRRESQVSVCFGGFLSHTARCYGPPTSTHKTLERHRPNTWGSAMEIDVKGKVKPPGLTEPSHAIHHLHSPCCLHSYPPPH